MAPGREAGFGDPDLRRVALRPDRLAGGGNGRRPIPPGGFRVPGAGEAVNADGVDVGHHPALAHQVQPVRIGRAGAAQHRLLAQPAHPVGGGADHRREHVPLEVELPVPVVEVVRLVPQLDPLEGAAVAADDEVEEVGVGLGIAGRRRGLGFDAQRRRRVGEAGEHLDVAGEPGQQPVVPGGAAVAVVVGPGDAGAQPLHADGGEPVQHLLDAIVLARAEPLDHADAAERRGEIALARPGHPLPAAHATRPRRASSSCAVSTRSTATSPAIQSTSSRKPASGETCALKPSNRAARAGSAKQWRMSPTR